MKILHVDLQYDYGMKDRGINEIGLKGFKQPFESLGHEVVSFYYDDYLNDIPLLQNELLKVAVQVKPDLIYFQLFKDQFLPDTLSELKSKYKTINWFGDDQWRFDNFTVKYAPLFTYNITTDHYAVSKYEKLGLKVFESQWAAIPDYTSDEVLPYKYDVSFVGGSHSVRRWFVAELERRGIKVATFGYGWPSGPISMAEIVRLFKQTKINLNLSNSVHYDFRYLSHNIKNPIVAYTNAKSVSQIKARNFEIPYYGGFQLTDFVPSLDQYFDIGKELICYRDVDEAALLIKHYLNNEAKREEIKTAGIKRARLEHSYLHRQKAILDEISKDLK